MKNFNIFLGLFCAIFALNAQETVVDLSLQSNYAKQVYFNFSSGQSAGFESEAWEIAFLRTSDFDFAERINANLGIEVYEASNNPADYDAVNPADLADGSQLYNSDTTWTIGAFDQGTATYGWGEYNPANHHVDGTVTFVLKYPDGQFKKMMIEDFASGYTFKYASWDETSQSWTDEHTETLPNTLNPGKLFNYFNLSTNQTVTASPDATNWDLVFQKYMTTVQGQKYPVIGALQNPAVTVAKNVGETIPDEADLDFSEKINTVGYDWKNFDGSGYVVDPDIYYYLKKEDGTVYRFHFLSFGGSGSGDFSLGYEDITAQMNVESFDKDNTFALYPNPAKSGQNITLLLDTQKQIDGTVSIYDLNGRQVFEQELKNEGFRKHSLQLSDLPSGVYLLKFRASQYQTTKKLIIQ